MKKRIRFSFHKQTGQNEHKNRNKLQFKPKNRAKLFGLESFVKIGVERIKSKV